MKNIWILLLLPLVANSDTTGNLLNQNFDSNAWSGTATGRHGSYEIAANHGQYLESTISLSNTLTEDQIKYGWTSTLGADIWHWNDATSETEMIQTITASDGTVTTQSRKVTISGCGYTNCGSHQTYTDSYTEGMNSNTDYDIKVRFNFSESTQSSGHWAVDLENPTLVVEYEPNPVFLSSAQTTEISTAIEEVEEFEFKEYKFEEVKVDITTEEIKFEDNFMYEDEIFFEQKEEEIVLDIVPVMEESYDDQKNYEEVSTEVKDFEEIFENGESQDNTTEEPIETAEEETETTTSTESTVSDDEPNRPDETTVATGQSRSEENQGVVVETVSVKDITDRVNRVLNRVDEKLVAISNITAQQMRNKNIDSYSNVNEKIFEQPILQDTDISYYINNTYTDIRNIYSDRTYEDRLWTSRQ